MGKQLGNNTMFDFSIGLEIPVSVSSNMEKKKKRPHLFTLWHDGVDFIDEDDGR